MIAFLYSVASFLLAISILVAVHEFGHYWVAKKLGVKVLKFSIGFGKPLWSKISGPDQTEYRLAAIPLGGYVQMLGENDPDAPIDPSERHRAFDTQPIWKRSLIVVAGPAINFLFAILLFMLLGLSAEERFAPVFGNQSAQSELGRAGVKSGDRLLSVDGRPAKFLSEHNLYIFNQVLSGEPLVFEIMTDTGLRVLEIPTEQIPIYNINPSSLVYQVGLLPRFEEASAELGMIVAGSPAEAAGLQVGDVITAINQSEVNRWSDLTALIEPRIEEQVQIEVMRGDETLEFFATTRLNDANGMRRGVLGIGRLPVSPLASDRMQIKRSLIETVEYGFVQTWQITTVTVRMLWKMLSLQVSPKNVNGPITIADVAGQTIQINWQAYVYFLAVISISLGIMNLLPIPMLDGGHLLTFGVEATAGRRASEVFYAAGQRVGIFLLLCLMSLAFYNDIFRLLN
ncbi:MAG: RIP metalloprotease RseP [Pseudomonadota bacterium]